MKSLRDTVASLEPENTKSFIKACLRTGKWSGYVWVIVEDEDDRVVYERFMKPETVRVCLSLAEDGTKGCRNVETIVSEIKSEEGCRLIFGIRDRDYTRYESGVYAIPEDVFVTDCRDIEMMMLSSPSVQKGLAEWNSDIPEVIMDCWPVARRYGYLRICNHRDGLGCDFKHRVRISKVWDDRIHSLRPDWSEYSMSLFLESCNVQFSEYRYDETVTSLSLDTESVYDVCQGHDVLSLLQYMLVKTHIYNTGTIREKMVNSYSYDDFSRTELYRSISSWETDRSVSVLR